MCAVLTWSTFRYHCPTNFYKSQMSKIGYPFIHGKFTKKSSVILEHWRTFPELLQLLWVKNGIKFQNFFPDSLKVGIIVHILQNLSALIPGITPMFQNYRSFFIFFLLCEFTTLSPSIVHLKSPFFHSPISNWCERITFSVHIINRLVKEN